MIFRDGDARREQQRCVIFVLENWRFDKRFDKVEGNVATMLDFKYFDILRSKNIGASLSMANIVNLYFSRALDVICPLFFIGDRKYFLTFQRTKFIFFLSLLALS